MTTQHVFETAGLGRAPFVFLGSENTAAGCDAMGTRVIGRIDGYEVRTTPGGTCAFCGRGIIILCHIRSADGRTFHVGSDCVAKTGDAGLKKVVAQHASMRRREAAKAKRASQSAVIRATLAEHEDALRAIPHPHEHRAAKGESLYDALAFRLERSDASGISRLAKELGVK